MPGPRRIPSLRWQRAVDEQHVGIRSGTEFPASVAPPPMATDTELIPSSSEQKRVQHSRQPRPAAGQCSTSSSTYTTRRGCRPAGRRTSWRPQRAQCEREAVTTSSPGGRDAASSSSAASGRGASSPLPGSNQAAASGILVRSHDFEQSQHAGETFGRPGRVAQHPQEPVGTHPGQC
jgi:hypothetical protein